MTLSFDQWATEQVEDRDLAGHARERATEDLLHDETLKALWKASEAADDRQHALHQYHADALGDGFEEYPAAILGE